MKNMMITTKKMAIGLFGLIVLSAFTWMNIDGDNAKNNSEPSAEGVEIVDQMKDPVHGFKTRVEYMDNCKVRIYFSATMDETWHVYSHYTPDGGPLPLEEDFSQIKFLKAIGKVKESAYHKEYDENFGVDVYSFDKKFEFWQDFEVLDVKAVQKTTIEIAGQTCTTVDGMCIPFYKDAVIDVDAKKVKPCKTAAVKSEVKEETLPVVSKEVENEDEGAVEVTISELDSTEKKEEAIVNKKGLILSGSASRLLDADDCEVVAYEESAPIGLWKLFIQAFLFGLAALLTPCVFPMIPMTVSFFMKDDKKKGVVNGIIYGLAIVLIYTIIGTVISITLGPDFANWLATHWIPNILFFVVFLIFAASFFGAFEIKLPSKFVNKMDQKADKGGLVGIFFMAFTLVLVSFSCTGPLVGSILIESFQGNAGIKPTIGMLGFSLAFALPFALFAIFPSMLNSLPKSGGWLNSVKVVLGFLELALGLKFLSIADQTYHWHILDREVYLAIWIVIFFLLGIYLLGKLRFSHDSEVKTVNITRLFLAITTFSFVVYMLPGMWGAPLKALSGYLPPMSSQDFNLSNLDEGKLAQSPCGGTPKYAQKLHIPHGLPGVFTYREGLECARELDRPLFIDFTGHGCVNCREMEAKVWSDPSVKAMLEKDFVIVSLYVDDKQLLPEEEWYTSKYDGKLKKTLGAMNFDFELCNFNENAQPAYFIMDSYSETLVSPKKNHDLNVDNFVQFLRKAKNEYDNLRITQKNN